MAKKKAAAKKAAPAVEARPKTATFPIKPRGDRVIVEAKTTAKETPGGIVLPDSAVEKSQVGTIVAVGPGSERDLNGNLIPLDLVVGQKVIILTFAGSPLEGNDSLGIADGRYTIMRAEDVIGTL